MPNPQNLKPFKKGGDERQNKKGRPPKLPELDVLLAKVLGAEKNGKTEAENILNAMKAQARKGNVRAAELLMDRSWGKVAQTMEFKGASFEATVFVLPNGREVQI
jgi:hypothetical protein